MTTSGRLKELIFAKGVKDLGKIKVNDTNCVAFAHHARHYFLANQQIRGRTWLEALLFLRFAEK